MELFIFEIRTFLLLKAIGYKAELLEVNGLQYSAVLLIRNKIKSFGMLPDREIQTNEARSKQWNAVFSIYGVILEVHNSHIFQTYFTFFLFLYNLAKLNTLSFILIKKCYIVSCT